MYEDFINALQNFRHNKIRTILSLLGIIIGVASVIVITTIGASATKNITSTFSGAGLDMVTVSPGGMRWQANSTAIQMDETFRQKLFDGVKNIKTIFYKNSFSATLRYQDVDASGQIHAVEGGYLDECGLLLESGALFKPADYVEGFQKIILGATMAATLFPNGDAVGNYVIMDNGGVRFGMQVAGVLAPVSGMGIEQPDNAAYVTRSFWRKKIGQSPFYAGTALVQVTNQNLSSQAVTDITSFITKLTGSANSAMIRSLESLLTQFSTITNTLSLMLSGVAAISLLVGGIGIMNIMIVTVTERRKEIGIRKALGATPAAIRNQFLVEAASITLLGGILGIVIGLVISFIVDYILNWVFMPQLTACFLSFLFSAFVGVFFGLSPAISAAKLDPVEALASE